MNATLNKEKINGYTEYASVYFNSITKTVINLDFEYSIDKSFEEILYRIDNWINEGSGWVVESINSEYVNISKYAPLFGSSFIELTDKLKHPMKGLINIKNNDNKCFLWCHVRYLNLVDKNSSRISKIDKKIADTLDYSDINFPVSEKDYSKTEDKNSININVFSYDDSVIHPICISNKIFSDHMNLLMIHEENMSHYVYIKYFNRLMFNKTKNKNKKHFCMLCLQCFSSENILVKHKENCLIINGEQRVKLNEGIIKFFNYFKKLPVSFKIYADFECILKETGVSEEIIDENSSYIKKYQNHIPCGFAYKAVCIDDGFTKDIVIYRGKDCVNKFIAMMLEEYEYCSNVMKEYFNKKLIMSAEEEEIFQSSNKCWICNKLFDLVDEKVRDHCHISGKFRGAVHFSCNANLKITKKVSVTFHNLRGYDGHLIMKERNNFDVIIDAIPNGLEKCMAFIINRNLVFIDSMQFMNSSLDSLVRNLVDEDFKYLSKEFKEFKDKDLKLLKEKGVYPYEYMNSFKKFNETELPSKNKFFSSLKHEDISGKDYEKAKDIWNTFNIRNLGEYHDLYLKTDVLLLCDVFEKFINTCLNYYGLDPCHYFSSPGLAWDAMLKMARIELELISDIDMYLSIEIAMREGISYIAKRCSKANNKYMKDYDNTEENIYIMYFDANNLYGSAMTKYLPYGGFE